MKRKAITSVVSLAPTLLMLMWAFPSVAGFSGDAVIDEGMPYQYIIRAGGRRPGIARSNNLACNSGSADDGEDVCPNDATFTPAKATGGYQAWAVGLLPLYDEAGLHLECGYKPAITYDNGDVSFESKFVCWPVIGQELSGYFGVAKWRMKWGKDIDGTSPISPYPTSIVAFHPNTLAPCNPNIGPVSASCGNESNSSYVVNAGYEAEISFIDTACSVGVRTNGFPDRAAGCFYYDTSTCITTLPASYRETVLGDLANVFNVGCGAGIAADIEQGVTYDAMLLFNSSGAAHMIGKVAIHSGAITTKIPPNHPACLFGSGDISYCYFSIDFASVGGGPQTSGIFSQVYE